MRNNGSDLGYVHEVLDEFDKQIQEKVDNRVIQPVPMQNTVNYILFLSIGNQSIRARVYKTLSTNYFKAFSRIREKAVELVKKHHLQPEWMKVDIVTQIESVPFDTLESGLKNFKKNYFRSGIAFDSDFRLAFLEQEVNGNAMIRETKDAPMHLNEKNINHYLQVNQKNKVQIPFLKKMYHGKNVYLFRTLGFFKDKTEDVYHELYDGDRTTGIRKVANIKQELETLIKQSANFLQEQIKQDGQFIYGYFPAFAKLIGTHNILRHSSSIYSLIEAYEVLEDDILIDKTEKGIDYLIRETLVYKDNGGKEAAFVVDKANHNEIKLGANATAILAMTKYMDVTKTDKYLQEAQALARGILYMKNSDGGFVHVLSYPSFDVKDAYRIIYYEGEAVFSLLRLYAQDNNELWIEEVKKSFEIFIENDYWKNHDHWLSYASNELTDYIPEDKYFIFGLKNADGRLDFIYNRITTYPTFLELTMAAYKMVQKIKKLKRSYLLEYINEPFLNQTIDRRAEYQRVGFFYPELAMYMKFPGLILNSFFIRHHSFRVRIDDIEHYLSGYCQYLQFRVPDIGQSLNQTIVEV